MQLAFQMHRQSLVRVAGRLQRAAHLTDLHIAVLLHLGTVAKSLELGFLLLEFFYFGHDSFSIFDFAFFTKFLGVLVVDIDLGLELVDFLVDTLLLEGVHLGLVLHLGGGIVPALRSVLGPGETALDFLVNLGDHLSQLDDELVLVFALVALALTIVDELVLEEVVVPLFARADVRLRIREQVVRAEGEEVELADL